MSGLVSVAVPTGEFGLGWYETAFAGGFEDGGAVALEIGLRSSQRRYSRLKPRELLFDLRYDLTLFVEGRERKWKSCDLWLTDGGHANHLLGVLSKIPSAFSEKAIAHKLWFGQITTKTNSNILALENTAL